MFSWHYPVCAFLVSILLLTQAASARPGESRSELEQRLLENRLAVKLPGDEAEERLLHGKLPYRRLFEHMPEGIEHVFYFKLAEEGRASTGDLDEPDRNGWELHVIYYRDKSVFESYARVGAAINQFEETGLLNRNKGASFWKKVTPQTAERSAFGYRYVREDGKLRALPGRRNFIIFMPEFDALVLESLEEANAEAREEAKEKAPDSLEGF